MYKKFVYSIRDPTREETKNSNRHTNYVVQFGTMSTQIQAALETVWVFGVGANKI